MDGRCYTRDQVARLFQVGPRTITRWVASGELPALIRPGRRSRLLFPADQIDALLERGTQPVDRVTIDVPPALRASMAQHPGVDWAAIARGAWRSTIDGHDERLAELDRLHRRVAELEARLEKIKALVREEV